MSEALSAVWSSLQAATAGGVALELPGIGVLQAFQTQRNQRVSAVPFRQPALARVLEGHKTLRLGGEEQRITATAYLTVPAGAMPDLANHPSPRGWYRAVLLWFADEFLARVAQAHPQLWAERLRDGEHYRYCGEASALLDQSLAGLVLAACRCEWHLASHHAMGVALALLEQGHVELVQARQRRVADRVHDLMALEPARYWTAAEAADALGMAASTLHRQLRAENSRFMAILQEVRLSRALVEVLNTSWPIAEIAARSGYQSPSRFAVRFKARFGVSPSELR